MLDVIPPPLKGIHHLKLPVSSLQRTHTFYKDVLHFTPIPEFTHTLANGSIYALMLSHKSSNLLLELRYDPTAAEAQQNWDPITWAVGTRADLEEWKNWFEKYGVECSRVLTGVKSWVLAARDPDGKIVRLYAAEEDHGWTSNVDVDETWLGIAHGDPDARGL